MKFCLSIDHYDWTRGHPDAVERTLELARLADQAGFDSVWLNEDPDGWDAFALLGAMSQVTNQILLGTGVTNAYHRNPNQLASSVATIDRLSAGRAFLGIGRGQPELYGAVFGLDIDDPLANVARAIRLLRQWWEGDGVATGPGLVSGASWRRSILPSSVPPIYLAAVGPRALHLAGEIADGVLFNELATPAFIRSAVGVVRRSASDAGRNPEHMAFFVNPAITVTDDPEPVLERKKSTIALVHALPGMERLLMSEHWDVPAIMATVRELMRTESVLAEGGHFFEMRQAGDVARARSVIPSGLVDEASAIGPLAHVMARVQEFRKAGATHLFVDRRGVPADLDAMASLLRELNAG